jgi:hypothetical protein
MQKACIIVPCYNEEHRLPTAAFLAAIRSSDIAAFCFVNDGQHRWDGGNPSLA